MPKSAGYSLPLTVVQLPHIEDAPQEERETEIYQWASLFKAKTWEEIRMIAENNDTLNQVVVTLKKLTDDEKISLQCEARERYEHDQEAILQRGIREGHTKLSTLIQKLIAANRSDEINRATSDEKYCEKLYKEFNL